MLNVALPQERTADRKSWVLLYLLVSVAIARCFAVRFARRARAGREAVRSPKCRLFQLALQLVAGRQLNAVHFSPLPRGPRFPRQGHVPLDLVVLIVLRGDLSGQRLVEDDGGRP